MDYGAAGGGAAPGHQHQVSEGGTGEEAVEVLLQGAPHRRRLLHLGLGRAERHLWNTEKRVSNTLTDKLVLIHTAHQETNICIRGNIS